MQNKPNLLDARMNVNKVLTKDYENKWQRRVRKNEPNTNPIKPNFRKAKMNVNSLITKDYRKKDDFAVRKNKPNSNPISEKPKMNVNLYVIENYENETAFRLEQNKPKQTQFQRRRTGERYKKTPELVKEMMEKVPVYKACKVVLSDVAADWS